ncbi:hypothetical protein JSY36_03970 [Bacillus sp. H-16]|uniref:hypothetical protein n=1 Tax=Alteribacter salitolerans TaxID=2912333 RepID=UPI001962BCA2|nr:hypothetical protein [Alteribacter salitolerans]MBM7094906.1 hypothetical protein [Alteribacter salitolerans]
MLSITLDKKASGNEVVMSEQTYRRYRYKSFKTVLHFGVLRKPLTIRINNSLPSDSIIIPQKLTNHIRVPELPYVCFVKNEELFLGPVIGYMPKKFTISNPQIWLNRFMGYEKVKGLIFIFNKKA